MKNRDLSVIFLGIISCCAHSAQAASTLHSMSDSELSATTGQALMSLSYISPTDAANLESIRSGNSNASNGGVGFYKLGLEGSLELNANIKKLQLGCGGINGAGACDIDIDYLSLSGDSNTSTGRASSSAKLTNPFMEFAIKNPNSASTRQVTGFRLSSEKAEGLITFGLENGANRSGINSLSGYMEVAQAGGMVTVNPLSNVCYNQSSRSDCATSTLVTNTSITGRATWPTIGIESKNYNLTLTPTQQGVLNLPQQAITGKRITSAPLSATAVVSGINLTGNMKVQAAGLINLNRDLAGTVNNLKVNVSIDEDLGYFHKANLNGTPASLSLQSADIRWPGTKSVAQQGWWLEFSNPIDIGDITPTKNVDIALGTIVETLGQVSDYLYDNPVNCGILLLNCLVGSTINVGNVNLTSSPPVSMGLQNLQLKNQDFAPNCYGGLKFC